MTTSTKTIASNLSAMMISQVITWILAFVLAIFIPRYLGATAIGEISIANSIWLILSVLMTFGMDYHLTKTVAREPSKAAEALSTSIILRAIFYVVALIVGTIYVNALNYGQEVINISYLTGINILFSVLSNAFFAVLTGIEQIGVVSFVGVITKALGTLLSIAAIFLGYGIYVIVGIGSITGILSLIILVYALQKQIKLKLWFNLDEAKFMVATSAQYLVMTVVIVVYQQIDKIFIAALVDARTVGWYGTAGNLAGTLMFIPVAFGTVIFPSLSRSYTTDKQQLFSITRRGFNLMFLLSVPVGFGILIIANPFVTLLYGNDFAQAGPILALMGAVLIFTYMNTFLGQLLIAIDRTARWNLVMIAGIILTLPLDYVLVPWTHQVYGNGGLGGAISFLITELIMLIGAILLLPRGIFEWSNVRSAALSVLAGVIMIAASWWWRYSLLPVTIIVAAFVYCSLVLLFRIVPINDLLLLLQPLRRSLDRFRRIKQPSSSIT